MIDLNNTTSFTKLAIEIEILLDSEKAEERIAKNKRMKVGWRYRHSAKTQGGYVRQYLTAVFWGIRQVEVAVNQANSAIFSSFSTKIELKRLKHYLRLFRINNVGKKEIIRANFLIPVEGATVE